MPAGALLHKQTYTVGFSITVPPLTDSEFATFYRVLPACNTMHW